MRRHPTATKTEIAANTSSKSEAMLTLAGVPQLSTALLSVLILTSTLTHHWHTGDVRINNVLIDTTLP